jgi:FkbM family methyltransferase
VHDIPKADGSDGLDDFERACLALSSARRVHDSDFQFFEALDGLKGLFIDVGANIGQTALSVFLINRSFDVFSFEPNRRLVTALEFVRRRFPYRFRYMLVGLSDQTFTASLHIPTVEGVDLSANAAIDVDEFNKDYVRERLWSEIRAAGKEEKPRFEAMPADFTTLDSLDLAPSVIKIDVEGHEARVIAGAIQTIRRYRPILLIENNNFLSFARVLKNLNYKPFRFDCEANKLRAITHKTQVWALNHFWINGDSPPELSSRLSNIVSCD